MKTTLEKLIWLSGSVGSDKDLAVGTGGNTSAKTDDQSAMYIKASGTALGAVDEYNGWRKVDTRAVLDLMVDPELLKMNATDREVAVAKKLVNACVDGLGNEPRPSVESTLHSFTGHYAVHLHALPSLAYVCAKEGERAVRKLFSDKATKPLWVPYANPGFDLGVMVKKYYDQYGDENRKAPEVMFFEKHGIMIGTDDVERTAELTKEVIRLCQDGLGRMPDELQNKPDPQGVDRAKELIDNAFKQNAWPAVKLNYYINPVVELYFSKDDCYELISEGPLIPDEIGFIENPIVIDQALLNETDNLLAAECEKTGTLSNMILVKGIGLFITGHKKFADIAQEVFSSSLYVRHFASKMGGLNVLTDQQQAFVKRWEGERYRVKQACQS
ncbi:MAG: class II aldolase/adducin family protein [Planctomycetota bacterium]|jgi:rhamnose utilization protein RhaD (predicted bifunctional aldolase and dehydrogenase)